MGRMTEEQILSSVKSLASNKGFYSTLYQALLEHPEELTALAKQDFKDIVDLVLYLES